MKEIKQVNLFKKDLKRVIKRHKDISKLFTVVELLAMGKDLKSHHHPHKLTGNYKNKWECHIEPDWLLIYEVTENAITLYRTGTHSDLFI
ncbi:MAG: type II toxin-antitoxin system YafQ family toxin [Rickettsiaceae bacterium]|nr:type II toxin-antitoxin system YafQ family toxin [Rickettsiaceae bacterium]